MTASATKQAHTTTQAYGASSLVFEFKFGCSGCATRLPWRWPRLRWSRCSDDCVEKIGLVQQANAAYAAYAAYTDMVAYEPDDADQGVPKRDRVAGG